MMLTMGAMVNCEEISLNWNYIIFKNFTYCLLLSNRVKKTFGDFVDLTSIFYDLKDFSRNPWNTE